MLTDFVWRCIQVHWAALWVRIRSQIWGKSIWGKHWILPDHSRRRRWDGHPIQLSLQVITKTIGDGHGLQSILYVPTPPFKDQSPRTLVSDPGYNLKLPRTPSLAPNKLYSRTSTTTCDDKRIPSVIWGVDMFFRIAFLPEGVPEMCPFCCSDGGDPFDSAMKKLSYRRSNQKWWNPWL